MIAPDALWVAERLNGKRKLSLTRIRQRRQFMKMGFALLKKRNCQQFPFLGLAASV
jgi:hypothetical protein